MRIETLSGVRLSVVALALSLQFNPAWAGVPETMDSSDDVPAGSLSPDEYQVNADGMKEDPNAKMSDVARAYRNGYINRGKQDQADYSAILTRTTTVNGNPRSSRLPGWMSRRCRRAFRTT